MHTRFTSLLLAIFLLSGQFILVEHQLDHAGDPDDLDCRLCLVASGLDQALVTFESPAIPIPGHTLITAGQASRIGVPASPVFLARAPPTALPGV